MKVAICQDTVSMGGYARLIGDFPSTSLNQCGHFCRHSWTDRGVARTMCCICYLRSRAPAQLVYGPCNICNVELRKADGVVTCPPATREPAER